MSEGRPKIEMFSDPAISEDGTLLMFTIETSDGDKSPVEMAISDVGMAAAFLVGAATRGCEMLGIEAANVDEAEIPIEPFPLRGFGIAQAPDRKSFHLVLRCPGIWLSFSLDDEQMASIATKFGNMAQMLAPSGKA